MLFMCRHERRQNRDILNIDVLSCILTSADLRLLFSLVLFLSSPQSEKCPRRITC